MFYWGARYYDPKTGRGLSADRRSVAEHVEGWRARMGVPGQPPLELNPYAYTANNPLRWIDPTGEATAVAGCAAGAWAGPWGCGIGAGAATLATILGGAAILTGDTPQKCDDDECKKLYARITARVNELKKRYSELVRNPLDLPEDGPRSVGGHQQQFRDKQENLRRLLNEANTKGCTNYQSDAWEWATKPTPSPGWGGPR